MYKTDNKVCFEFFLARFFTMFYLQGSTYALSFFLSFDLLAIYSIALDFYKLGLSFIGSIARVLFTTLSSTLDFVLLKTVTFLCLLFHLIMVPPVFFYGGILLDELFSFDVDLLFDLSLLLYISLTFVIVNSFWGYPLLSAINKDREGHICLLVSAFAYYLALVITISNSQIGIINAVLCIIFAEFIGFLMRLIFAIRNKIIP